MHFLTLISTIDGEGKNEFFVKDCFFSLLKLTFAVKKLYNNVGMNSTLIYRVKKRIWRWFIE